MFCPYIFPYSICLCLSRTDITDDGGSAGGAVFRPYISSPYSICLCLSRTDITDGGTAGAVFRPYISSPYSICLCLSRTDITDDGGSAGGAMRRVVRCAGCGGEVTGTYYRCCTCLDVALCHMCEQLGIHLEHDMVTVATVASFRRVRGSLKGMFPNFARISGTILEVRNTEKFQ
jgi:hypothetical protein